MYTKRFTPCIYLYHGHAVSGLDDLTILETDPVRLGKFYSENNADDIIIFDMSHTDEEHDEALDIIKEICQNVQVDVYAGGNIKRMEDVKKYLYAGCKKAILDYSKPENIAITEEVSLKFGKDKIYAAVSDVSAVTDNLDLLNGYVSQLLIMDVHTVKEIATIIGLPAIVSIRQLALNKFLEIFSLENVCAMTGNFINENAKEILNLKDLCKENGILIEAFDPTISWEELKKNSDGMVPVVVQDHVTDEVLMVAYMNEEAYKTTLRTGKMCYYSRSRQELWLKGETSGHFQYVKSLTADCDFDTILAKVAQVGVACHTGAKSCFFRPIVEKSEEKMDNPLTVFEEVFAVIMDRKIHPKEGSYTNYLFEKGIDKILKKVGEEATEIVIAAKNPNANEIKYEIADFLYHMMVLMAEKEITWEEITEELAKR